MGRTALYRDAVPWRPPRAEVQLEPDVLLVRMPDGRLRRHLLDGCTPATIDGCYTADLDAPYERRFVRMLVLEHETERATLITPPDQGAITPNVVRVPEAPVEAAIIDAASWDAIADWVMGGGRFAACSISDLARLAQIASPQFAVLIGEVAAQRALELVWVARGPLRGATDLDSMLQPLVDAAKQSPRAAEALVSAFAHVAGATRRRRKRW